MHKNLPISYNTPAVWGKSKDMYVDKKWLQRTSQQNCNDSTVFPEVEQKTDEQDVSISLRTT